MNPGTFAFLCEMAAPSTRRNPFASEALSKLSSFLELLDEGEAYYDSITSNPSPAHLATTEALGNDRGPGSALSEDKKGSNVEQKRLAEARDSSDETTSAGGSGASPPHETQRQLFADQPKRTPIETCSRPTPPALCSRNVEPQVPLVSCGHRAGSMSSSSWSPKIFEKKERTACTREMGVHQTGNARSSPLIGASASQDDVSGRTLRALKDRVRLVLDEPDFMFFPLSTLTH